MFYTGEFHHYQYCFYIIRYDLLVIHSIHRGEEIPSLSTVIIMVNYLWFMALPIINQHSAKICQAQLFIISRCRGNVTPAALVQCHLSKSSRFCWRTFSRPAARLVITLLFGTGALAHKGKRQLPLFLFAVNKTHIDVCFFFTELFS